MIINVTGIDISRCLADANNGDQQAWDAIVAEYSNLVWSVARSFRLTSADAADVYQATWLRLVENLGRIREGERLGAWLSTTARRETLALLRRGRRSVSVSDVEEYVNLWRAFGLLPDQCQRLLRVLFADPPPSYTEASAALEIPIGSIGPTRARCLGNLHNLLISETTP
jgi:RNA polymerase sigma factor (sigma-70 family)